MECANDVSEEPMIVGLSEEVFKPLIDRAAARVVVERIWKVKERNSWMQIRRDRVRKRKAIETLGREPNLTSE